MGPRDCDCSRLQAGAGVPAPHRSKFSLPLGRYRGVAHSRAKVGGARLRALDGLRGAAALIVLFHHAAMTWAPLAVLYFHAHAPVPFLALLVAYTPLHLLWAGSEAVIVFFVLSGFVLVLPHVTGRSIGWPGYYLSLLLPF